MEKSKLNVPMARRSVEVINSLREDFLNCDIDDNSLANAVSTANNYDSSMEHQGMIPDNYLQRNMAHNDCITYDESSLGLLDIDKDSDEMNLMSRMKNDFKSLSFHPKEMAGRSTCIQNNGKTNANRQSSVSFGKKLNIDDLLRDANQQSKAVDEILKSSDNPNVANIRMSLDSYKQSLSGTRSKKDSWNFRPDDFGRNNISESNSDMRDSMFRPANKIDMSKEELSWMKEHGDLPVYQSSATFTSGSDKNNSNRHLLPNDSYNEFASMRSNIINTSKMSVGNYFKRRSENIKQMLSAPSPEKKGPFPPLYDLENESDAVDTDRASYVPKKLGETYHKRRTTKSLPFQTISDDSALSDRDLESPSAHTDVAVLTHVNNLYNSAFPNVCRDITNVVDDTSYGSPISCSQIQHLVENYGMEKKSILLDKLLAQSKQKRSSRSNMASDNREIKENVKSSENFHSPIENKHTHRNDKECRKSTKQQHSVREVSPTLPEKSSFGHFSNIFHSTKHGDESVDDRLLQDLTPTNFKCDKKKSSINSESSRLQNTINNEEYSSDFVSTLKNYGKSNSGSSGFTESSVKSSGTVIQVKHVNPLMPIRERDAVNTISCNDLVPERDIGIGCSTMQHSQDLSLSESSKEIMNLMSPASSKNKSRDLELSSLVTDEGVSSMKVTLNDLSKECIPSTTPYKTERFNLSKSDSTQLERSTVSDFSINIPNPGDWIAVESKQESLLVGTSNDINLTLTSLCRRWISVTFVINAFYVNGEQYNDEDIAQVVLLQAPSRPLLLKADSQSICKLLAVPLLPNLKLKISLTLNLMDMVTKTNSKIVHDIFLMTNLPQFQIKCDFLKSEAIHFPCLPQGVEVRVPIMLYNDSDIDFPININICCSQKNIFSIGGMSIISRSEADESVSKITSLKKMIVTDESGELHNTLTNAEQFIVPKDDNVCIKIFLHYNPPLLNSSKELNSVQYIDAMLNIVTYSQMNPEVEIPLMRCSLVGGVGVMKLKLDCKQGINPILVNQGSVEVVTLKNCGTLTSFYKLFVSDTMIDQQTMLMPSENPIFVIDPHKVNLKPGEEASLTISYPVSNEHVCGEVHRMLMIVNSFMKESYKLAGITAARSLSQQSVYSVDSATSQPMDLCIKSTRRGISWGSLKLGAGRIEEISLKNTSYHKKIRIFVSIKEDSFKLINENGSTSSQTFTLLPQECKTLQVEFRPNKAGGHMGAIKVFCRTKDTLVFLFKAQLHGVGDVSTLVFRDGVFKHGGSQGLPLGPFSESGDVKDIHFTIWNKGTASAFFLLNLDLKWKYRTLRDEVQVIPQCGIIGANCTMPCVVRVPKKAVLLTRRQDGDSETLAALTILHGDDSTRQRIKRICSNNVIDESMKEKWNKECQGKLNSLCMHFPEEDQCYGNISDFKESPDVLELLLDELQQKEVSLTYDINLENTMVRMSSDFDETIQFHTMIVDNTHNSISSDF